MKYEIDKERLARARGKLCPCLLPTKENENDQTGDFCPCAEFIVNDNCRCGIFKEVKENE